MMNFKTRGLVVLLIISMFLLSSCEVYQTLYGTAPPTGQATAPSENVSMEKPAEEVSGEVVMEEKPEEEVVEEAPAEEAPAETVVEKTSEKPVVIVVQETELVSLSPEAEDPDKETNLVFTFTSPLNETANGKLAMGTLESTLLQSQFQTAYQQLQGMF